MNLFKIKKSKFIKLIMSILIVMIAISQIENRLSLDVVLAEEKKFTYNNIDYYYDTEQQCVYLYNADKTARLRATLKDGKFEVQTNGNDSYSLYVKDENGNFAEIPDSTLQYVYSQFDNDNSYLDILSHNITESVVSKATGIKVNKADTDSKKTVKTNNELNKIGKDYAKYNFDALTQKLTVEYYDPNSKDGDSIGSIVTKTYSYENGKFVMDNPDNGGDSVYYQQINSDEHNSKYKVYTEIPYDQIESITGISKDDLPSYIGEANYKDDFESLIDGAAGVILYPAKVLPLLLGKAMETAMGLFTENGLSLTLDDILFNRVEILSVNFFDLNTSNSVVNTIRKNVATWYYGIRNLSAVILFIILIYTGLKMAITNIAEEKSRYSEMIVDWVVSIALLFLLHYLMQFIIIANNQLVNVFSKGLTDQKEETIDMVDQFFKNAWSLGFTKGVGSALAYLLLVGMTFVFLLSYLKRMITTGFLIVIAPLVTITYSIDKMGDNKSQALNNWLKEFAYNILIQLFHCGTYLALVQSAMKVLNQEKSLAAVIVAFIMIVFMYEAEKIIKLIFRFNPQSMSDTVGHAAYYATIMGTAGSIVGGTNNKYQNNNSVMEKSETKQLYGNTQSYTNNSNKNNSNNTRNNLKDNSSNRNRINDAISTVTNNSLFQAGVTANKVASKMILGVGLAGATGDPTTMLSAGVNAFKNGVASGKDYKEDRNKHELQQAYSGAEQEARDGIINEKLKQKMNLKDLNNLTDDQKEEANRYKEQIKREEGGEIDAQAKEQVRTRADAILNGDTPQTEAEKNLSDAMAKLKRGYKSNGMSDKNVYKQVSNDLVDIRSGKYTEATNLQINAKNAANKVSDIADVIASPVKDVKKFYRNKNNSQN